ncbi:MAG: TonB-dependent receptor plug domain-containing protein, partial [Planctomycetes bacterium]|nr:TonB-dependent receptor plug domain-containing protein [Planctomycetota bacterium]
MRFWKVAAVILLSGSSGLMTTAAQELPSEEDATADSAAEAPGLIPELPETTVEAELQQQDVSAPTRTLTPLDQVASSTTVVTGEQLRDQNFAIVAEALRGVPGLDVVRAGPVGGQTSVFLRGANSQHTKVLLDGIPINDPGNAGRSFDFSTLTVDEIDHIEIVRGPQSTLYGTDAIGGVVSIVTRRGQGPLTVQAIAEGGSFGTHREGLRASGGNECINYSLGGSFLQMDGFSAASERLGAIEDDGLRLGTISGRFGWTPSDNVDVDWIVRWIDSRADLDDAPFTLGQPPTDDPWRLYLTKQLFSRIQLTWRTLDDAIEQKISFNLTDYDRQDTDDAFPSDFTGRRQFFDWQANFQLTCNNLLTVGTDYMDESASSFAPTGFPVFAEAS